MVRSVLDEMEAEQLALQNAFTTFLKGMDESLPDRLYDSECVDAWAASKGYHVDRKSYKHDGDDMIVICAWRDGYTFRVSFSPVLSEIKQEADWKARREKEAA